MKKIRKMFFSFEIEVVDPLNIVIGIILGLILNIYNVMHLFFKYA